MSQKKTIEIDIPKDLLDKADECAEDRGFDGIEDFVTKAIRDAVNADDPFTEEAREEIRKARESDEGWISLEEVKQEIEEDIGIDE